MSTNHSPIPPSSGVLLVVVALVAIVWANSPWAESYDRLWHLAIRERTLEWFVNDALMAVFFFVVAMEIRCELHDGALAGWRQAALPTAAALGGMIVPVAVYLSIAAPGTRSGWGVPMATDIAFALTILTLLGKRVPAALRVLLLALAIIDDLGAIVIIALFYSADLALSGLLIAAGGLACILAMQRLRVRPKLAYLLPSIVVWFGILRAGIHPTIAGVIVGMVTPAAPAENLIATLRPWVAFAIMPVFALANAGVSLRGEDGISWRLVAATSAGLILGKPVGVFLASTLAVRLRLATLPAGLGARHLVLLGFVAGVGFTMSMFIAGLAFTNGPLLRSAKLGVLAATGGAAALGLVLGWLLLTKRKGRGHAA